MIILSLSEKKIGDNRVKFLIEYKGWNKLNALNLNTTELTDISLGYLREVSMPSLKN